MTDRRTDGRTDGRAITYRVLSMLSRAKNRNQQQFIVYDVEIASILNLQISRSIPHSRWGKVGVFFIIHSAFLRNLMVKILYKSVYIAKFITNHQILCVFFWLQCTSGYLQTVQFSAHYFVSTTIILQYILFQTALVKIPSSMPRMKSSTTPLDGGGGLYMVRLPFLSVILTGSLKLLT